MASPMPVSGIGITLYAAIRLGVPLRVENVPGAPLVLRPEQFLGAIGVTVSFAVALLAVSAAVVGLFGTAYTRHVKVPSMVITIPAIGTLLPGTALYRGMLEVSLGHGDAGAGRAPHHGAPEPLEVLLPEDLVLQLLTLGHLVGPLG